MAFYQPCSPCHDTVVKREPPARDHYQPNSISHAPKPSPQPAFHPSSGPYHSLTPPPNYFDSQPQRMSNDNGQLVPLVLGAYPPNNYPPLPTPISQQAPYEPHGDYTFQPNLSYIASYSSGLPAKRRSTRASQACDQCRQLKGKCDETKPCKACRDKGLECKYRDPVPKAPDNVQTDILREITATKSTLDRLVEQIGRMDDRLTKIEVGVSWSGVNSVNVESDPMMEGHFEVRQESPYIADGAPVKTFDSYTSREDTLNPEQMPHLRMMGEDEVEAEPAPSLPPGEPAIPINHTTSAGLLLEWSSIRDLTKSYMEREGIRCVSEYPISHEQDRGPLIVYGRGEDSRQSRHKGEATDHGRLDMANDSSKLVSPSPAAGFGQEGGLKGLEMVEYNGGVLGPGGNPDFTEMKVWSYVESFKEHILNMHPIVQPANLDYWVRHFLDNLPTAHPRCAQQPAAKAHFVILTNTSQSSNETTGSKRKRSAGPDGSDGPPTPTPASSGKPPRSIHSALILTVLALGKICQHRDRVPDIVHPNSETGSQGSPVVRNGVPQTSSQGSSPGHSSHSNSSAQSSPREQHEQNSQSRRPSVHGSIGYHSASYDLKKNYEVIPGLEYFAYATDILGNLAGGYNDMKDVYANIFASLYFGQLNRPLESFAYIHRASHKLMIIMRPSLDKLRKFKKHSELIQEPKYNQLALAFWTCLQLESDLIAELPLPPSGLLSYEDDMPHPNMSLLEGFNQRVLDSYPGQLYLRTHLNSIHRMFYTPDNPHRPGQDKFQNVSLVADAVSGMDWVAPSFAFKEGDPPAPDILAARLRAKYWGAQVITYRPFVRQILQFSHSIANHPQNPNPPTLSEIRDGIIAPSINPGAKSLREIDAGVVEMAGKGIKALVESTRAFHNLGELRPIITNVFGTAHAQWGNLLVLSATYKDPLLHRFVDEGTLRTLFSKTIQFLRQSATSTSSLRIDMRILEGLQQELFIAPDPRTGSSLSSHTSNPHTQDRVD